MVRRFCLLVVLACCAGTASAQSLQRSLDRCLDEIQQHSPESEGQSRVELDFYCPGLTETINQSVLGRALDQPLDSVSSVAELEDLKHYLESNRSPSTAALRFNFDSLPALLDDIHLRKPEPEKSLWDQFVEWLKQYMPEQKEGDNDWLVEFLKAIAPPEWVAKALFEGIMIVIILMALFMFAHEWRHYKRYGPRTRKAAAHTGVAHSYDADSGLTLDHIAQLPLEQRIPALLKLVIQTLVVTRHLPEQRSLTPRECVQQLKPDAPVDAGYFGQLVGLAERIVYGNQTVAEDEVHRMQTQASDLLQNKVGKT